MQSVDLVEGAKVPAAAAVTYYLSLQAAQFAGRACRVSCVTPRLSSVLGCLAVSSSSLAAGQVSFALQKYLREGPGRPEDFVISKRDAAFSVIAGLVAYKLFGGRFCNLMPSHVCHQGAFSKFSIPAKGTNLANHHQTRKIRTAFLRDGCHHCGRRFGRSIADHIPTNKAVKDLQQQSKYGMPAKNKLYINRMIEILRRWMVGEPKTKVAPQSLNQRFYPQCESCSKKQSAFVRYGKDPFVIHWTPNVSHLSGLLLGAYPYEGHTTSEKPRKK